MKGSRMRGGEVGEKMRGGRREDEGMVNTELRDHVAM